MTATRKERSSSTLLEIAFTYAGHRIGIGIPLILVRCVSRTRINQSSV